MERSATVRLLAWPQLFHALRDLVRMAAAAAGVYVLLNLAGELLFPPFDTVGMWLSLPPPGWLRGLFELALGGIPVARAYLGFRRRRWRAPAAIIVALAGEEDSSSPIRNTAHA